MRHIAIFAMLLLLSMAAFLASASALFLASQGLWTHAYYAGNPERFYAWAYYGDSHGFARLMWWLCLGVGLAVALAVARLGWMVARRIMDPPKPLYGKARWQSLAGAWRAGLRFRRMPRNDEILIGWVRIIGFKFYVSFPGDRHISLNAPTGGGKGVSFVIPNALNWGGPVFCFSVKRDVLLQTAAERERLGNKVFVLDVTEPNGETNSWSGMGDVRRGEADSYDDIQKIMFHIIPETRANNPYWDNAARMVATAVGVMIAETPDESLSIGAILRVVESPTYENDLRGMIDRARLEQRPFPKAAVDTALAWLDNKAEEAAAAVRANIVTALSLWHVPRIDSATATSDFTLQGIRERQISVFVCAQPGDIRRLRVIYGLFFTQFIQSNARTEFNDLPSKPKIRTLCILDEMWALGEMKELADALAFIRSFGIRMAVVLQTKDQLAKSFGDEGARNLFNNTAVELVYGEGTQETAKEVSERGGMQTVNEVSTSRPKYVPFSLVRHNENESVKQRPLILPQEVPEIPADKVIVQMKGKPPFIINRIFWYKDSFLSAKAGAPPPMPKLTVRMPMDMETIQLQ